MSIRALLAKHFLPAFSGHLSIALPQRSLTSGECGDLMAGGLDAIPLVQWRFSILVAFSLARPGTRPDPRGPRPLGPDHPLVLCFATAYGCDRNIRWSLRTIDHNGNCPWSRRKHRSREQDLAIHKEPMATAVLMEVESLIGLCRIRPPSWSS
ncbi:hypothetical protein P170DRAFT_123450 [Aspergillus steynii IBT 23096]|uniref:Uncharacterized protein n=1 Tax=Aspergillus steynii IBT 23096 TaxID=1392250 RepID=A0A2I2GJR2_9EURO|nr:uncharacterized protein P170DRAFT_123450 [Aspergillus steynii IBT 23096]PLB53112.1 hypothetical protein P170DRAFT_123450 [Aspergillus steynii IBT 23096]